MGLSMKRTTVNQLVALAVFLVLLSYAWNRDMLLKPDPVVPFRGRAPTAERGQDFYLFPTSPAFFVRLDSRDGRDGRSAADLLQEQFEQDASALRLLQRMVRVHLRSYVPARAQEMQALDIASPHALWGVYIGTFGLLAHPFFPRTGADRSHETIRFNMLMQFVKPKPSLLSSNDRDILVWNRSSNLWEHRPQARSDSSVTATVTLESQLRPGQQKLFTVHLGTNSKPLPGLKAVVQSLQHGFRRPHSVFVDFVVGAGRGLTYDAPQPAEEAAELGKVLRMLMTRNPDDYLELMLLDQPGCTVETPGSNTTFLGQTVWRVEHPDVAGLASQLVEASMAQHSQQHVCRLLLVNTPYFTAPAPPYGEYFLVALALVAVLLFACRRRGGQKREE